MGTYHQEPHLSCLETTIRNSIHEVFKYANCQQPRLTQVFTLISLICVLVRIIGSCPQQQLGSLVCVPKAYPQKQVLSDDCITTSQP